MRLKDINRAKGLLKRLSPLDEGFNGDLMRRYLRYKERNTMAVIAYLKQQCGWSRGVREVLAKYGIEYEERQIHIQENYIEMVEKTQQTNQPCVQLDDNLILVDISGEELAGYFDEHGVEQLAEGDPNVPLDRSCTDAEHAEMQAVSMGAVNQPQKMPTGSVNVDLGHRVIDTEVEKPALEESPKTTTGGSKPHIPIKDTGFYGAR